MTFLTQKPLFSSYVDLETNERYVLFDSVLVKEFDGMHSLLTKHVSLSADLVHAPGQLRARPPGPQQGNLHHQVVPHGPWHRQSQHEPHPCQVRHFLGRRRISGNIYY